MNTADRARLEALIAEQLEAHGFGQSYMRNGARAVARNVAMTAYELGVTAHEREVARHGDALGQNGGGHG